MSAIKLDEQTYTVSWGGDTRELSVPRENLTAQLTMTQRPPVDDLFGRIVEVLEHPIGCPPMSAQVKPGQKVALVTGDRITDVMLGRRDGIGVQLLDYLNRRGIRDEDVSLIHAGGAHANPDWEQRFGPSLLRRVKASRHDARDEANLTFLGVTERCTPVWVNRAVVEADFSLAVGEISPTVHGGWCGGGKIILPGVAGMDSIEQNHSFMMRNLNTLGLADGNHMRRDMEEAARLSGLSMKLDILVDSAGAVVDVYAGDFVLEHRAALPAAREIWMTKMDPVDLYVVYPGEGHEEHLSSSLWIRLEAADLALKSDGIAILALSAAGGWASPSAVAHDMVAPSDLLMRTTEELARLMARKEGNIRNVSMLYSARRVLERRRVVLVCDGIQPADARAMGFAHCTPRFEEALEFALSDRGRDATIAVNIQSRIGWRTLPWREG